MTVPVPVAQSRPAGGWAPEPLARRWPAVTTVALSAATGVLVVAAAYTAGRLGYASARWAQGVYWLGQALIVVPAAARLLPRRPGARGQAAIVVIFTVAEYLVKVCYSPAYFTFADELQHWRSTQDVLQTGRLFTPNQLLPVSPHYPGLEEVTAALRSVCGLPLFACGLIVAGAAHLLFACLLYLLFTRVSGPHRLGGAALLLYAGDSHFSYIDSIFGYQTLALAFLGLALFATWHVTAPPAGGRRGRWLTVAVLAIVATVVTHHITSYALVIALCVISLGFLLAGGRRQAGWAALLALVSAAAAAAWLALAAPKTVPYLEPVPAWVLHGVIGFFLAGPSSAPPAAAGPPGCQALSALASLIMAVLLPAGWWHVWRRHRRDPWTVAMAAGSVSWFALIPVRLLVSYGSELAGRGATFAYVPAAYVAALALAHYAGAAARRWRRAAAATAALAAAALVFNGLANGWPPYWERLPGPHQVAGFERSVGPEEIAAARWALAALGPGQRFAADWGNYQVLGSYGDQDMVTGIGYLYTSRVLSRGDAWRALDQGVRYVLADRRLSRAVPAQGSYFPGAPPWASARPMAAAGLAKFGRTAGVSRLYDSGNIVIYDLWGWEHAP